MFKSLLGVFLLISSVLFCGAEEPPRPKIQLESPHEMWTYKEVDGKDFQLSVFLPDDYHTSKNTLKLFPTVVIFHGGSWNAGEPSWHYPDCRYWSRRGMIAVSVDYRLKDRDNVEVPLECVKDAKSAIRFLRENSKQLKVDPDRIVAAGGSAGGQLAAGLATITVPESNDGNDDVEVSCKPNAIVLFNPWFKCQPQLSPSKLVTQNLPPVLTFLGDQDSAIPVGEMKTFHQSLIAAGNDSRLYVGKGGKHGFCNGRNARNPFFYWSLELTDKFLVDKGILSGKSLVEIPAGVKRLRFEDYLDFKSQVPRPARPNVVMMLVDDLGWQDVGCFDIDQPCPFETPNIDRLASQGTKFWQAYSPAPTCAPSRVAILSGKHPARSQKTHVVGGAPPAPYSKNSPLIDPWYSGRLRVSEVTIAEALKTNGYTTGQSGKWHAAINHRAFPQASDQGFDVESMERGVTIPMKPDRLTEFATKNAGDPYQLDANGFPFHENSEQALKFLKENHHQPFFLYYCTWLVHTPIHTRNRRLLQKYCQKMNVPFPDDPTSWEVPGQKNPYYASMVETLDYHVGRIIGYLEETDDPRWPGHKLSENTYVIFTSDNGGMERTPGEMITDNAPLDKGKINAKEGGVRVPLILAGPDIQAGAESHAMVNGVDFYPTILNWTGTKKPVTQHLDGVDLVPYLKSDLADVDLIVDANGKTRDTMIWHFPHSSMQSTIRQGNFKLIRNWKDYLQPDRSGLELYQLYDSANQRVDIEEANNLAETQPAKARALDALLERHLMEMKASPPLYNSICNARLAGKARVCTPIEHGRQGNWVWCKFRENGARIVKANLIFTNNGGAKYEEWYRAEAKVEGNRIEVELPAGTTHYVFNLIDENHFLISYPTIPDGDHMRKTRDLFSKYAWQVTN